MPRLPSANQFAEPKRSYEPPNTANLLASTLDEWQYVNGAMPEGLPRTSGEAARWWLLEMQEPELPGETRRVPRGDSTYWHLGYYGRTRQALLNFLRFDKTQRETVMAAVEDGIPYRGDDWEFFLSVIRETDERNRVGADQYRKEALLRMKSLRLSIKRAAA